MALTSTAGPSYFKSDWISFRLTLFFDRGWSDLRAFAVHFDINPHPRGKTQRFAHGDWQHDLPFGGDQYSAHDGLSKEIYRVGILGVCGNLVGMRAR